MELTNRKFGGDMKINQVEELVGITKKNIRFYEEQRLLTPARNPENGYRDYSLKDVEALNKIKLLRQLDVPIEQIRRMQEGTLSLAACLDAHMIHLSHRQHDLELMKEICVRMSEQETDLAGMNPSEYFEAIAEMEERGVRFMNIAQNDIKKRRTGPIIAAIAAIVFWVAMEAVVLWLCHIDPETPVIVPVISTVLVLLFIVCIIIALMQRLREIKGGELDEAANY
jgi:DNA-binding transcriptional MerR regulator